MPKFVAFTSLGRKALPNQFDVFALALVFAVLIAVVHAGSRRAAALKSSRCDGDPPRDRQPPLLRPAHDLAHVHRARSSRSIFTFTYATLAAKSRRAGAGADSGARRLAIRADPRISSPSWSCSSSICFPARWLATRRRRSSRSSRARPGTWPSPSINRCATCRRISQEVTAGFHLTPWQRFWQLETPFAIPGLVWNMMMSMSGGWFFVVAAEAITVGENSTKLPGIGSYIDLATSKSDYGAVVAAVVMMGLVILAYDQLLFRPLVAFSRRAFASNSSPSQQQERSWVMRCFRADTLAQAIVAQVPGARVPAHGADAAAEAVKRARTFEERPQRRLAPFRLSTDVDRSTAFITLVAAYSVDHDLSSGIVSTTISLAGSPAAPSSSRLYTMVRVFVMIVIASAIWVPLGILDRSCALSSPTPSSLWPSFWPRFRRT